MKKLAKRLISSVAPRLPWGVREAFLTGIARSDDYRLLHESASVYGICGFVANGEYGFIQGSITDNVVFRTYARTGFWAKRTNTLVSEFLSDGGLYLDIGGNIGLTTIPIAKNADVECVVFEPEPTNFRHLSANITANCGNGNVTTHNLALFDRETSICFEVSPTNSGDNRIRMTGEGGTYGEENWQTIEVQTARLDDLGIMPREPMAAKIDTQGAEPFIVAGGSKTLAQAGLLAIEFWPYGMARMGGNPEVVIQFLGDSFKRGIVSKGDSEEFGEWQPIEAVTSQLADLVRKGGELELGHLNVLVKKG